MAERTHKTASDADRLGEALEHRSPEGRPADPAHETRNAWIVIGVIVLIAIGVGAAIGAIFDRWLAGVVIALVLVGLGLVFNPTVWAFRVRAKERERVKEELAHERR